MRKALILLSLITLPVFLSPVFAGGSIDSPPAQKSITPTPHPLATGVFSVPPSPASVFSTLPQYDSVEELTETGDMLAETAHFYFLAKDEYWPVDLASFTRAAEDAFDYVSARMQSTTDIKTIVLFEPPSAALCPARGLATTDPDDGSLPIVSIFADENTDRAQIMGVLAHEVAHVLQAHGNEHRWTTPHRPLNEGAATWATGQYWVEWQDTPSFDANVRAYLDQSTYLPLYENYGFSLAYSGENCIERRDILYTEWASFIEFLINEFGFDQFQALLRSSPAEQTHINGEQVHVESTADFETVYGSALNQLEAHWLDYLTAEAD